MSRIERRDFLRGAFGLFAGALLSPVRLALGEPAADAASRPDRKKRDLNVGILTIGQSAFKAIETVANNCGESVRYAFADEDETSASGLPEGVFVRIRKHQFKRDRKQLTWADSREQRKIDRYVNGLDVNIVVLSPPPYDDDYETYTLVADYAFFSNKRKPYAKRVLIAHENACYAHDRLGLDHAADITVEFMGGYQDEGEQARFDSMQDEMTAHIATELVQSALSGGPSALTGGRIAGLIRSAGPKEFLSDISLIENTHF